jgi:hypothetical protein
LAEVLQLGGRQPEAEAVLEQAAERYEQKGCRPTAARVHAAALSARTAQPLAAGRSR